MLDALQEPVRRVEISKTSGTYNHGLQLPPIMMYPKGSRRIGANQ
jgi:hypothetical protein